MSERISIYDSAAVDRLRAELKFEPRRLRAARTALMKKFLGVEAALAELPAMRICPVSSSIRGLLAIAIGRRPNWCCEPGRVVDRVGRDADRHRTGVALRVVTDRLPGACAFAPPAR
jgi:hypothetical protein